MKTTITQLKNIIFIHNQTVISEGLLALLRTYGKYNVIVVSDSKENLIHPNYKLKFKENIFIFHLKYRI